MTLPLPVHDEPTDVPVPDPETAPRRDAALEALRNVWDPELGLDIVALGLVYDVRAVGDRVEVDMTLTTPGCPVSEQLPSEAADAVRAALPDAEVELNVVWDPPWNPDRISPEGLEQLGYSPRR